jgi:hypothetical protein
MEDGFSVTDSIIPSRSSVFYVRLDITGYVLSHSILQLFDEVLTVLSYEFDVVLNTLGFDPYPADDPVSVVTVVRGESPRL